MSTTVTVSGTSYSVPVEGDSNWGTDVSNLLIRLSDSSKVLQNTSTSFNLQNDLNLGTTYGLKLAYLKSQATNPASAGVVRLGNAESIKWRNQANNADLDLTVNSSDVLQFNGSSILMPGIGSIVNADISNSAAIAYSKLNLTGNIVNADISNSAAIAYSKLNLSTSIVNADISTSAAIAYSKLNLSGSILNADINASAAISYSKLNLSNSITNADISSSAAIVYSKLIISDNDLTISKTSGLQTALDSKVDKTTLTTKGDIYVATAASTVTRLPAGSDGQVLVADSSQSTGLKWTSSASAPSSTNEISNLTIATSVSSNALTIAVKDQSGADPSVGSPVKIGMRSSTTSSGVYNQRSISSALSLTISSGSTLGHTSGNLHKIFVYLIDNAGTLELAVSQALFLETKLVSTTAEGGAGAADSNALMYSATARSNVPCRLIAVLESTQTTAGTWATNMSSIKLGNWALLREEFIVWAKYRNTTGNVIPTSASTAPFATKDKDYTNNIASDIFTANVTGRFKVSLKLGTQSQAWAANSYFYAGLAKNGTSVTETIAQVNVNSAITTSVALTGENIVDLAVGDTVRIRYLTNDTGHNLTASGVDNFWSVELIQLL